MHQLGPEAAPGPVDSGAVAGEDPVPGSNPGPDGILPERNVVEIQHHFVSVVAGSFEQPLKRQLQRVRARAAKASTDDAKRHAGSISSTLPLVNGCRPCAFEVRT